MKNFTSEEQQRLWKLDEPPIRKILLWGLDSQNNPCLLILFGKQEVERELRSSPRSYYADAYLLKSNVSYTKYAVFHGVNGHLPSIPNVCYCEEKDVLCYTKGYKTANRYWDYHSSTGWQQYFEIDKQYIIEEFYALEPNVVFNYYTNNQYADYVAHLNANHVQFEDFTLIAEPSDLFGFAANRPDLELIVKMCSSERVYSRRKYLRQWIGTQPAAADYEQLLQVASVELACGIFQELTIAKNPILLQTARQLAQSSVLWANERYHSGLTRCARQYITLFDEQLLSEQKEFIYRTLPEMDFQIKHLKLNGNKLKGEALEEYLNQPNAYQKLLYGYPCVFGNQNLYQKNTYTDGKNVNHIAFKNTVQTAVSYGMADAVGKIAYYLDAPRTSCYFKGSGKAGAYRYYLRYLRRTLDQYRAADEAKFIAAAREMLTSYTDHDHLDMDYNDLSFNFFFQRYFNEIRANEEAAEHLLWRRNLADVLFIAQNAKALRVHEFCYAILKKADAEHQLDALEPKTLIALSAIPYEKTARLFEQILLPKLNAYTEFDPEIMIALMNTSSEQLWEAAKDYFRRTNGAFQPQHMADFLFLDTLDTWGSILEENIAHFTIAEYTVFLKTIVEKRACFFEQQIVLSEQITELLLQSVRKLEGAATAEQQELLRYFATLLLSPEQLPDFLFALTETILFRLPSDVLKTTLEEMDLTHSKISEKKYNTVSLLKSCKEDTLPKDSLILSILETGSKRLVKTLTEQIDRHQALLAERTSTLLLLFECNVSHLNQVAQAVFERLPTERRDAAHLILLDSPVERAYRYGLKKLDDWYQNQVPTPFITRMMEHPCVEVKAYLSQKMKYAFSEWKEASPDLYLYYTKALLYLPNQVCKSKEQVYHTIPLFLKYYPEKRKELEQILLDLGSTNRKTDSERALVAFAQIQKEVSGL